MLHRLSLSVRRIRGGVLTFAWPLAILIWPPLLSVAQAASQAQIDTAWNKGVAWLLTHQRADGSWRSTAGTEVMATATALEALNRVNVKGYPFALGVAWLSNAEAASVDSLARRIMALK